jgi:hypothetical protein
MIELFKHERDYGDCGDYLRRDPIFHIYREVLTFVDQFTAGCEVLTNFADIAMACWPITFRMK